MSFLKNLMTGSRGIKAATNVHLAELAIPKLSSMEKSRTKDEMVKMWVRSQPGVSISTRIASFSKYDRLTQLNYLAIAMYLAGIPSPVAGEDWNHVDHPGTNVPDVSDLSVNADWFEKKRGVTVSLGVTPLDISSW